VLGALPAGPLGLSLAPGPAQPGAWFFSDLVRSGAGTGPDVVSRFLLPEIPPTAIRVRVHHPVPLLHRPCSRELLTAVACSMSAVPQALAGLAVIAPWPIPTWAMELAAPCRSHRLFRCARPLPRKPAPRGLSLKISQASALVSLG